MRDNKYYMDAHRATENSEDDINWSEFLKKVWNIRKRLCKAAVVGVILGLIIGFSIPKHYSVAVVLSPELSTGKTGSGIASLASSFLGGLAQGGDDALSALQAPEIVSSTPYLLELLDSRVVNEGQQIDMKLSEYLDTEKGAWWTAIMGLPRKAISLVKSLFVEKKETAVSGGEQKSVLYLSEEQLQKLRLLRTKIAVTVDKKAGIITFDVGLQDPVITATLADSVMTKLQKYIVDYKVSKAKDDCKYWEVLYNENKEHYYAAQSRYAKYVDANSNVVLQSSLVERERLQNEVSIAYQGYSQVAQQLQVAQAKLQEAKPAFTVLEPAVVPLYPDTIGKFTVILMCVMLMVGICAVWELYASTLIRNWKNKLS